MDPDFFEGLAKAAELGGAAISVITTIVAGVATVLALFRKRIKAWWQPYRAAVEAMADIPGIKDSVEKSRGEISAVRSSLNLLTLTMRARTDNNVEAAEFECGPDGANTYVNTTYARWMGVGKNEILGWNWVNFIHPEDQHRVRKEWDRCRAEHRPYRQQYRMMTASGEVFLVTAYCTPIPDLPPAFSWVGIIRREEDQS